MQRGAAVLRNYGVYSHIEEIRSYLETSSPMIPNGVVIAFDGSVEFRPSSWKTLTTKFSRMGSLRIPLACDGERRAGFIVDGQQRLAAIREAHIKEFPIFVNAFITDDVRTQTEQFILVNSTKPLPKGLLYELLPSTDARLPTQRGQRSDRPVRRRQPASEQWDPVLTTPLAGRVPADAGLPHRPQGRGRAVA